MRGDRSPAGGGQTQHVSRPVAKRVHEQAKAGDCLRADVGIDRLLLEGGGGINGSFVSAGLIDEISLLILPAADGSRSMPMIFDRAAVPATSLSLVSVEQLQGDVVYLRHRPR
ncbi:dihydrofolate reductase family protein [Rhizobium sp. 3T7]|uniref:dihydrofolate reductase family protein n=1 Tax=Rhizobium sp. 3T7 TaxID=2874922 RepID=UPI001CCA6D70|nr:dihydrofolate reductase family protein [Rhizobium sp. 3T7]MBZ9793327.1 dihydrofolate reductase family protein [Rhizobium sp. 3T7]